MNLVKITQVLVWLLILTANLYAQVPNIDWAKNYGGSSDDECFTMNTTSDGGYILGGWTTSTDGEVTGFQGGWDYWVAKLDASGTLQWQKSLGGSGGDEVRSIQQTNDGNYIALGFTDTNDGDVSGSGHHGGVDWWLVKLDSSGNILFKKAYGGSQNDSSFAVKQTSDNGYILAGSTSSNDGDVAGSGYHGTKDFFVVKTDGSGNISWKKSLGGTADDEANDIIQTADGGYMVVGFTGSNNGDVSGHHNTSYYDAWVVKLDASGNISWKKVYGGNYNEEFRAVQQTGDGGYAFLGYARSSDGDVGSNHGNNSDYWVVKTDANGTIQWEKSFGGTFNDEGFAIDKTTDGGFILNGWATSTDGDVTGNKGSRDYWVVKISQSGSLQWQKSLGGTSNDYGYTVKETADGGYAAAGGAKSNNGDVTAAKGFEDYWVIKFAGNSCGLSASPATINVPSASGTTNINVTVNSGISWNILENCSWLSANPANGTNSGSTTISYDQNTGSQRSCSVAISCGTDTVYVTIKQDSLTSLQEKIPNTFATLVYPNPFENITTLRFEQAGKYKVVVRDIWGSKVKSVLSSHTSIVELNFSGVSTGIYFYTVTDEKGKVSQGKLLVQ